MADLITKGMSDWEKPINDFAKEMLGWQTLINNFTKTNTINAGAWSDTGLTYENGFSAHSNDITNTFKYRTWTLGGKTIAVQFAGYVNTPAINPPSAISFVKIPSGILQAGFASIVGGYSQFTGQMVRVNVKRTTNELTVELSANDAKSTQAGGELLVNELCTW